MRKILAVAALLLLAACQTATVATTTFDPAGAQKSVFALKSGYAAVLSAAVAYNERPRCGLPRSPVLCSKQEVVVQLRKADAAAGAAIDAAEDAVRSLSQSPTVVEAAIKAAKQALEAFNVIQSVYLK